jgi:hypothetical protein
MKKQKLELQKGFMYVDLRNTVAADWNYKEDGEELMKKLTLNLLTEGNIVNCILRTNEFSELEVIDGNHRRQAILKVLDCVENYDLYPEGSIERFYATKYNESGLDFTKIMCYYAGAITIQEAEAISLKVNETRFKSNDEKLKNIVEGLTNFYGDSIFEQIPFEKEDFFLPQLDMEFSKGGFDNEFQNEYSNQQNWKTIKLVVNDDIYQKWLEVQSDFQTLHDTTSSETIFEKLLDIYGKQGE